VEDGLHLGDKERPGLVLPVGVVEELLAERVLALAFANLHVLVERLLELRSLNAHLLGDVGDRVELLHEAATDVVLRKQSLSAFVTLNNVRRRTLQCHSISLPA
jgi:hypothetical protein